LPSGCNRIDRYNKRVIYVFIIKGTDC